MVSASVSERRREIGIRIAIGATAGRVTRALLGSATAVVLIGGLAGMGGVLLSGRLIDRFLFRVSHLEPVAILGSFGLLAVGALIASALAARRAARLDPRSALAAD